MKHALNDELEQQKSCYHKCIVYKLTVCCKKSSYHVIIMQQSGEYSHCWCSERIKVQQSGHRRGWLRVDWTCLGANYIQAATKIITPNQSRSTFDKEILEMMDRQVLHIWQFRKWSTKDEIFCKWQRKKDSPSGNANKDCMKVSMDDNDNGYSRWKGLSDKNVTRSPYKLSNHRLAHT